MQKSKEFKNTYESRSQRSSKVATQSDDEFGMHR
jgi:hypothetical protein